MHNCPKCGDWCDCESTGCAHACPAIVDRRGHVMHPMCFCVRCGSYYSQPGTCNCFYRPTVTTGSGTA